MTYPVVEIFDSPQGEGVHAGVAMTFVRLAGCNVGKPLHDKAAYGVHAGVAMTSVRLAGCNVGKPLHDKAAYGVTALKVFPMWAEECHSWSGDSFVCDTNYKMTERMTVDQILARVTRQRICLTGGEPLMHDVQPLLREAWFRNHIVHIETSGTKSLKEIDKDAMTVLPRFHVDFAFVDVARNKLWICVSPKRDYLPDHLQYADEIKVLIDAANFDEGKFLTHFGRFINQGKVSISPVNDMEQFNKENAQLCLKLQDKHPSLRISIQMHKVLSCR